MTGLGRNQRAMLNALQRHGGSWSPRSGWDWNGRHQTVLLLGTLVNRGLVEKKEDGSYHLVTVTPKLRDPEGERMDLEADRYERKTFGRFQ